MKIFCKTLAVIIFLLMLFYFYGYKFTHVELYLGSKFLDTNAFIYFLFEILVTGMLITYLWFLPSRRETAKKLKEYQNKLEKTSVNAETESSKTEILEAKIRSLETALQAALEKQNQ